MVSDTSQICHQYRYVFWFSSIASLSLIVSKSRSCMNCRTIVSECFCNLEKYCKIDINEVIDYRVFRYRLKVSISFLLLTWAKNVHIQRNVSCWGASVTCKQKLLSTNIKKVIYTFVIYYIKSCNLLFLNCLNYDITMCINIFKNMFLCSFYRIFEVFEGRLVNS